MSLLINALKKYKQRTLSSPLSMPEEDVVDKSPTPIKIKKILIISLVTVIIISLTSMVSFLIFKHIEKRRIAAMVQGKSPQAQKIKELIAARQGGNGNATSNSQAEAASGVGSGVLKERLKQKMQQTQNSATSAVPSSNTSTAATDTSSENTSSEDVVTAPVASSDPVAPPVAAAAAAMTQSGGNRALRSKLAGRAGGRIGAQNNPATTDDNNDSSTTNSESSTADTSDTADNNSVDSDTTNDDSADANDNASETSDKKVAIKVVADQSGANNPTYQQALAFMKLNQYDKAIPLLADNDDLLLKTQGLSALLLARIYLATSQYNLASDVLEHAVLLHAGSDMELLSLRAQTMFMQGLYQQAIDILSSQSPSLVNYPGYYALLADAYMHVDQASNAVSIFQQIVQIFPESPNYWLGLAVAYQKSGEANSAIVAYRRAAQLSQSDPQVSLFINQQLQALQTL